MRHPVLLAAMLLVAVPLSLPAQVVRGHLSDSLTRAPLGGAFLTLIDSTGAERARAIADRAGAFLIRAPEPGQYRLRSKRIGFRPYISPPLTLGAGATVEHHARIHPVPVPLQEIVVEGERRCDVVGGSSVAALWDEVREALAAVSWSARVSGYWYETTRFERDVSLDDQTTERDSTWRLGGYHRTPFRSAPPEQLAAWGYVTTEGDEWVYYAPDADVLISAPFVRTHCFEALVGRGETAGLLGLGFAPERGRELPDVRGTLWIDRESGELRHLEFTYTRLPRRLFEPRAGGRIEFLRVPSGAWIVREWIIRMPTMSTVVVRGVPQAPTVTGFRETGGQAVAIRTRDGAVLYSTPTRVATADAPSPQPAAAAAADTTADAAAAAPVAHDVEEDEERPRRRSELLLEDEFQGTTALDAYALVQQYRPSWLRFRGPRSILLTGAGRVQVYVEGMRMGEAGALRDIPIHSVLALRFYDGSEATTRFGTGHGGGVIEVRLR